MNKTTEALKLAEEALTGLTENDSVNAYFADKSNKALVAIREALADHVEQNLTMVAEPVIPEWVDVDDYEEPPEQEPVAYALSHLMGLEFGSKYPMQETKEAAEQMARQHMGAVVVTPLYAVPVSVEAIRAEALEEAAKVCEEIMEYGEYPDCEAEQCAAAIRSMK